MNRDPRAADSEFALPSELAQPPIPASARTILVFGGSFDPPHVGHHRLGLASRDASGADWLLLIPAGRSPHKDKQPLFSGEERLSLLNEAFAGEERVSISCVEIDRLRDAPNQPSYTVDTLRDLRSHLPATTRLRLLIGADQALSLHRWREPGAILELAEPVIMRRSSDDASAELLAQRIASNWAGTTTGADQAAWLKRIVDVPLIDASSTEVQELLDAPDEHGGRRGELLGTTVLERVRALRSDR